MQAYMRLSTDFYIIFLATISLIACEAKTNTKVELINPSFDTLRIAKIISLRDLVKNYNSLDGQVIQTEGIVYFEFENMAIYADKEYDSKCFWLDLNNDLPINDSLLQTISGQKLVIKGTVDNSSKGHLNAYVATIRNVYYLKTK